MTQVDSVRVNPRILFGGCEIETLSSSGRHNVWNVLVFVIVMKASLKLSHHVRDAESRQLQRSEVSTALKLFLQPVDRFHLYESTNFFHLPCHFKLRFLFLTAKSNLAVTSSITPAVYI